MITFNETIANVQFIFKYELATIFESLQEVTIIRDVYGKIHLYIKNTDNTPLTDEQNNQIHHTMSEKIGSYYTNDIWENNNQQVIDSGLIHIIESERVQLDEKIFLLERHRAKHIWASRKDGQPPWKLELVDKGHKPAIVSFFSFKGGTGRTTALVGTALTLAKAGKRVIIVDLDLEAPGLSSIFYPENIINAGVVDYLIEKEIHKKWKIHQLFLPISDPLLIGKGEPITVIPAGTIDDHFIQKLARIDFQHLTTNQMGTRLKEMLKEIISNKPSTDFIFLDARAGFHDIGGFALSDLSHAAVIAGQHTKQTWAGLAHVIKRIAIPYGQDDSERLPTILVHSMAPSHSDSLLKSFREKAYDVFQQYYYREDETIPNITNKEEPFYPFHIPWNDTLRGDMYLYAEPQRDRESEEQRLENLLKELTSEPYEQLAIRLCSLFNKQYDRGE